MTGRQSPPTERVLAVLSLLGEEPHRRLTLTEISVRLGLSKPTCLGILAALTEAGFATRDDVKAYGLGPALLRLGWAAETGLASLDIVRPHIRRLHEQLGLPCVLAGLHEESLVVLDRVGRIPVGDHRDIVGERFPCTPPLGLTNTAWRDDEAVRDWLARPPLVPIAVTEERTWALVRAARERGYLVERRTGEDTATPTIVLANLEVSGLPRPVRDVLRRHMPPAEWAEYTTELPDDDAEMVPLAALSAPIHDRLGRQRYTLTLLADRAQAPAGVCRSWASALTAATAAATTALGG
ncbi:IclR family transcriptional regulator [Yinghuangia sp. YIM S09857]|uniref:IclR family transcriptional regulator n=1 Tax=Yinghuangia sp. YIM S09857 TaxID=3436929 RepID=UPI003F52D052